MREFLSGFLNRGLPIICGLAGLIDAFLKYLRDLPYEMAAILGVLWFILVELDELKEKL